jgi:hypothetical protein
MDLSALLPHAPDGGMRGRARRAWLHVPALMALRFLGADVLVSNDLQIKSKKILFAG